MSKLEANANAPNFVLNDFNGNPVELKTFRNQKNVLLVFNRGFL
jgi:peroxiredoxin